MSDDSSTGVTAAATREWAGEEVRRLLRDSAPAYRHELATIQAGWRSKGEGWPQTVGEPSRPARVQVRADRYELALALPPEAEDIARSLGESLRAAAEADATLGERVRSARIPDADFTPERRDSPDYGEGAWRVVVPVVIHSLDTAPGA